MDVEGASPAVRSRPARRGAVAGSLAGFALVGWEAAVALVRGGPGLRETVWDAAFALAISVCVGLILGTVAGVVRPRWPVTFALAAWGAVVLPGVLHRELGVGGADLLPALAPLALALVLPRAAAALGIAALVVLPVAGAPRWDTRDPPGGGSLPAQPEPAGRGAPDILLVTVDAVRADAGLALPVTCRTWTEAVAPAPWTLPALYALLGGEPVTRTRGGLPAPGGGWTRPVAWRPLATRFAAAGYATAAFVSNPWLDPAFGFDEGFSRFVHADRFREPHLGRQAWEGWRRRVTGRVERLRHRRDDLLVDAALAWWATEPGRPRFAWIHLLAPHEYARDPQARVAGWRPGTADPAVLAAAYAVAVAATGERLGRLVRGVGPALVAVTADHGEAFGEPGGRGHGLDLSDPELRVPLAICGPGIAPGRVEGQVATADLGAALAGLAGIAPLPDPLLPFRERVAVGGLRRGVQAFGWRRAGGGLDPAPPPDPHALPGSSP